VNPKDNYNPETHISTHSLRATPAITRGYLFDEAYTELVTGGLTRRRAMPDRFSDHRFRSLLAPLCGESLASILASG